MGKLKELFKKKDKNVQAEAPVEEDEVAEEDIEPEEEPEEKSEEESIEGAEEEVKEAAANVKKAKADLKEAQPKERMPTIQEVLESHEARIQKIEYHLRI